MVLRKQTSYFQTFEVSMEFSSRRVGCEAGLVLWWSQFSYATIGIRIGGTLSDSERPHVVSRTPKGRPGEFHVRLPWQRQWTTCGDADLIPVQTTSSGVSASVAPALSTTVPVKLTLVCDGSKYTLGFDQGPRGGQTYVSCSAEDLTIMPPVGGAFTGVMFGVYAFGRGEPVLDPADFNDVRVFTRAT